MDSGRIPKTYRAKVIEAVSAAVLDYKPRNHEEALRSLEAQAGVLASSYCATHNLPTDLFEPMAEDILAALDARRDGYRGN